MSIFYHGSADDCRVPYGMCLDAGRVVKYYPEQQVIKQIIQLHQAGTGAAVIARILNESGVGTRHNKLWTYNQVRRVLKRWHDEND